MKLDTNLMNQYIEQLRRVVPMVGTGGGIEAESSALRNFQDAMKGLQAVLDIAEGDKHPDSKAVNARVSALRGEEKAVARKATAKKAAAKKAPAKKAPAKKAVAKKKR